MGLPRKLKDIVDDWNSSLIHQLQISGSNTRCFLFVLSKLTVCIVSLPLHCGQLFPTFL
jgi:hypothetical protein